MKVIKLYVLRHGDISGAYTIDYDGPEDFHEGMAGSVVQRAKKQFRIAGKQFIVLYAGKTYFVTKLAREWKFYPLGE